MHAIVERLPFRPCNLHTTLVIEAKWHHAVARAEPVALPTRVVLAPISAARQAPDRNPSCDILCGPQAQNTAMPPFGKVAAAWWLVTVVVAMAVAVPTVDAARNTGNCAGMLKPPKSQLQSVELQLMLSEQYLLQVLASEQATEQQRLDDAVEEVARCDRLLLPKMAQGGCKATWLRYKVR